MKKPTRMKSFTDVLNDRLDIVEKATGKRPTLKEIAEYLGMQESTFSKKHNNQNTVIPVKDNGEQEFIYDIADFTCNQMIKIVRFFNDHGDTNCTLLTLLYGDKVEEWGYKIPLSAPALDWLSKIGDENPEYIKVLDFLLTDKNNIGERLLSAFLFYCYRAVFSVNTAEMGKSVLSYDASTEVLKMLALQHLSSVLDDVSELWSTNYEHDLDAIRKKAIELRKKEKECEGSEITEQLSPSKDEINRLKAKQKANVRYKKGYSTAAEIINNVKFLSSKPKEWVRFADEEHTHFPVLEFRDFSDD